MKTEGNLVMDDELDYIVSSYASLKLNGVNSRGSPLKDIGINTSPKSKVISPQKRNSAIIKKSPLEIHKLCLNVIELGTSRLSSLRKLKTSFVRLISASFQQLYKIEDDLTTDQIKMIRRKNHSFIITLLDTETYLKSDFNTTLSQIKLLYLRQNKLHIENQDLDPVDILFKSGSISLKFMILQIIFKQFQQKCYTFESQLTQVLLDDAQYFDNLSPNQKISLVRLVLSFETISPSIHFKLSMQIKYLELLIKFDFKFESYVLNVTQNDYIKSLEKCLLDLAVFGEVPNFLYKFALLDSSQSLKPVIESYNMALIDDASYSSIQWKQINPDAKSMKGLSKLLRLPNVNKNIILHELNNYGKPNSSIFGELGIFIVHHLHEPDDDLRNIMDFYFSHIGQLTKPILMVLDRFVLHSNNFIGSPRFLQSSLEKLTNLFSVNNQSKRLRNVSNLYYNIALKLKGEDEILTFSTQALRIEVELFKTSGSFSDLVVKLERNSKVLKKAGIDSSPLTKLVLSNEILDRIEATNLLNKIETLEKQKYLKVVASSLMFESLDQLSEQNRTIIFCICAKSSRSDQLVLFNHIDIKEPLYQMICGIVYQNLPFVKTQIIKPPIPNITNADPLVRSFYYLVQEIKAKTTFNLKKIIQMYHQTWLLRNKSTFDQFEFDFLKLLVRYLKFVNFQKLLREVLSLLEVYEDLGNQEFNTWLQAEKVENKLELKETSLSTLTSLNSLSSEIDFESHTETFIRQMNAKILKIRYYLVSYDKDHLLETCDSIEESLTKNSLVLSIDNENKYSKRKFLDILILLVKLHIIRAKVCHALGFHLEAITSASSASQLSKSILKSDPGNLEAIALISSSFRNLIFILIHLGIAKDADYFVQEFTKLGDSLIKYKSVYAQINYFVSYYFFVIGKLNVCRSVKEKADEAFDALKLNENGGYLDNYKLVFYKLISDIYSEEESPIPEAKKKLKAFFSFVENDGRKLSSSWIQQYEYIFCIEVTLKNTDNPYIRAMDLMNGARNLFFTAQKTLNVDPLFSTLEESAMSIPSSKSDGYDDSIQTSKHKSKNTKKRSILQLTQSQKIIMDLFQDLDYLSNHHTDELYKVLALDLLTLSSISDTDDKSLIERCFQLNDYAKHQPLANEKRMIDLTSSSNDTVPKFDLVRPSSSMLNFDQASVDSNILDRLPNDWLVITIDICSFNGDLIISRFEKGLKSPNILRLPLSRHSSRTVDEVSFSFHDAMAEFHEIIDKSTETTSLKRTTSVSTSEDKRKWHEERFSLDQELKALFAKIEYCWLGGFKGIFNPEKIPPEQIKIFKEKFLSIIRQNIPSRSQKNQQGATSLVEIDDFVVELFLKLGDPSKLVSTELLEDLIYFVLDILLFHGEENAYDEIDIDGIYVQVEGLINEYILSNPTLSKNKHTVLVVGKECQAIPWESLPCLRDTPTTRMPSLSLLLKLFESNRDLNINRKNGSFIVNPSGDLSKTEGRMKSIFDELTQEHNWTGTVGEKPSEDLFEEFLTDSNVFIYVGHGGGEQYIKSTTIKKQTKIAPALLLGCSSASVSDNNLLGPSGTVYSYLIGGCPMVLGNLWDVTDKDIDKFSESVFRNWGLIKSTEENQTDICDAVRKSRDVCNLKYLNGAAPVVYGLPLSLLD